VDLRLEPPQTDKEIQLARIWAELLHVNYSRIGRNTSFFELGGDSISAIQLVAACKTIGIELKSNDIFRKPDLKQMSVIENLDSVRKEKFELS
jgi:acyl carrier protein